MLTDGWARNGNIHIHYLDSSGEGSDPTLVPLVFVPGMLGSAEDFRQEMEALKPRRCIAISLRGRGKSDAPRSGYSFADQVGDIAAVIGHLDLDDLCLMGYSVGSAYALGYAIRHPARLNGLIIADYPARYPRISIEWVERARAASLDRLPLYVLQGLQHESEEIELWDRLENIGCPTLIMRGDQPGSLLSVEDAERYIQTLPIAIHVVFTGSGHELWQPSYDRFLGAIKSFLGQLDRMA